MGETLRAWWQLSRPAGLWIPPLLPLLGYAWAHWDRALLVWGLDALPWVLAAWVALQAGTLWLNAARDQDTGEVLLGQPVTVPPRTAWAGMLSLAAAVALAAAAGWVPFALTAGCAALAVLYSHPMTAWKAHPVLGPAVNVVGYGLLSPAAGYAIVGTPVTPRSVATLGLVAVSVLGWTFIAQAFQETEDRERGDRTLVATHGSRATLRAGRICLGAVGLGIAVLIAIGWYPWPVLVCLPAFWWIDRRLRRWIREGGTERVARRLVGAGLIALGLMVGGAFADYVQDSLADGPVAGLGTRSGHPSDRAPRPASVQQALDFHHRTSQQGLYYPN